LNLVAAGHFGRTKAQLESAGLRIADADLLIASVAMAHGAALVTGNRRHYDRISGLPLEDWIRG
jgi:predicted nucleic acid-binding protein